jgi:nitrite reductase/ring-hydroxylating ferredoxin subunit
VVKRCSHDGCNKHIVKGGVCITHGAVVNRKSGVAMQRAPRLGHPYWGKALIGTPKFMMVDWLCYKGSKLL